MFGFSRSVAGLALTALLGLDWAALAAEAKSIEVVTVRDQPISGADSPRLQSVTVRVYEIDGLQRLESAVSKNIARPADMARAEALRRIGELNDGQVASGRETAYGLAKALHHGIDRYPAIVIDGKIVIYGVPDLVEAVNRYEAWRGAQSP